MSRMCNLDSTKNAEIEIAIFLHVKHSKSMNNDQRTGPNNHIGNKIS